MKDTWGHLSRKLQHQLGEQAFPTDLLQPINVATKFAGHIGFPELADSIAYEPVQSLLAVGTQDGRVKLIGKPGVEVTLRSTSRSPTKYLGFVPNKGAVLRVPQDGDIQLFSVVEQKLLTSTWLHGDTITAVAVLPDDPYILLGCASGNVRIVALLGEDGLPAEGAQQAVDLSLQPYQVLAQDLDAKGPVVSLDVTRLQGRPLLLLVHQNSGALVWDIRAEKIIAAALDDENEVSKPTSACWVGERANCFAVGYDDGSILLYGVPQAALQEDPLKVTSPYDVQLLMTFRVAAHRVRAAPVKSLSFVAGDKGEDWLLVLGGQGLDEPDMLSKLPLASQSAAKTIPWFGTIRGHALVPCQGSLSASDSPSAVMVLTEGGQLVVHDLGSWQPMPLTLPFQELPPISVARVVPTVSLALLGMSDTPQPSPISTISSRSGRAPEPQRPAVQHALTLDTLRKVSRRGSHQRGSGSGADAWPLHGGEPAAQFAAASGGVAVGRHPSALYFTGHRDGRVRVWDITSRVPQLLQMLPASAGQERLRQVSALEVCPFSGIVIVGHQGGEVRLYQFSDSQQTVHRMNVDESGVPYDNVAAQPPGFQYVMRYSIHSADISCVCLATKLKLASVGDGSGMVSVLDLMQPGMLWSTKAMQRPVRHLAVGCHVPPPPRSDKGQPEQQQQQPTGEAERLVVFAAGDDSTLLMLTLEKGEPFDKPMRPKNASRPLAMALLDVNGTLVPSPLGAMKFPWANNNNAPNLPERNPSDEPEQQARQQSLEVPLPSNLSPNPAAAQRQASVGPESVRSMPAPAPSVEAPESSTTSDHLEMHELPSDEEIDTQLAAAAAAAEGKQAKAKGKFKLPKGFLRPGGAKRTSSMEADLPSPTSPGPGGSSTPRKPRSATPSATMSPQASLEAPPGEGTGGASAEEAEGELGPQVVVPLADAIGSPTLNLTPDRPTPTPKQEGPVHVDYLVDYPYLIDAEPMPAVYVLLCTEDYLRVYSTENVRLGDRSTVKKAYEETPAVFAGAFMCTHGPGVVTVSSDGTLAVRTVPGLECLYRLRLDHSNLLGFKWGFGPAPASVAGTCACSLDGQLVLAGPSNEIARMLVVEDCVEPVAPVSAYDVALAAAASAALQAAAAALARQRSGGDYVVKEATPEPEEMTEQQKADHKGKGLGRFFNSVKGTATGVLDTASKTAQNLAQATMHELDRGIKTLTTSGGEGSGSGGQYRRELPTLPSLFATPVEPLEEVEDIDYMTEEEEPLPASPQQSAEPSPTTKPSPSAKPSPTAKSAGGAGGLLRFGSSKEKKDAKEKKKKVERGELLQGAKPDFKSQPAHMRTTSSIREAYGRPRHTERSNEVKGIMEENKRMLQERGEKLQDLEQRTAQMQDDASDFASLAKQLEGMYANRKWWQM